MLSTSYADDPELLVRMVRQSDERRRHRSPTCRVPLRAKPVALLATRQLRDREVRRDKMVRAIWVLRSLLREYGRRLADAGVFDTADDVFYLLVDELDSAPGRRVGAGGPAPGRTTQAGRRRSADGVQRELAAVHHIVGGPRQWGHPARGRRLRGTGTRPGADRAARDHRRPATRARSSSPRSPTSATPPRSATPRPW